MKHNKGPWRLETKHINQIEHIWIVAEDGKNVAVIVTHSANESSHANAALIGAAPELLAHLKWALKRIQHYALGEGEYFERAEAAIDKAEGK
jgi:hypothetical protein